MGKLVELTYMYLPDNQLVGTIPTEFGLCTKMYLFYLYNNQLSGVIPSELGTWTLLNNFRLYNNPSLGGAIPTEVQALSIPSCYLYSCNFTCVGIITNTWCDMNTDYGC